MLRGEGGRGPGETSVEENSPIHLSFSLVLSECATSFRVAICPSRQPIPYQFPPSSSVWREGGRPLAWKRRDPPSVRHTPLGLITAVWAPLNPPLLAGWRTHKHARRRPRNGRSPPRISAALPRTGAAGEGGMWGGGQFLPLCFLSLPLSQGGGHLLAQPNAPFMAHRRGMTAHKKTV